MDNKMKFDIQLSNIEYVNPLFSKAKAFIMYHGDNRNKSAMTKEVVEAQIPSLYNCPVIGEFNETLDDFRGHGGKVEITDEGIKYIQTTRPYGLIPESSEVKWENVVEANGTIREYLTCTVYLWTGRYPEAESVIANGKSQSMEIDEVTGYQRKDGFFQIESFTFSALCLLGDDIEPCFESASVVAYSLDKNTFKQEFELMIKELKQSFNESTTSNNQEKIGGKEMENMENKEFENEENQENSNLENQESQETSEENQFEHKEDNQGENSDNEDFALSTEQVKKEIRRALRSNSFTDEWGWECQNFYYVDYDGEYVYAEDEKNRYLVALPYTMNGDAINVDFSSPKRIKVTYTLFEDGMEVQQFEIMSSDKNEYEIKKSLKDKETKIFELNTEITRINSENTTLQSELEDLKEYKRLNEEAKSKQDKEKIKQEKESMFSEYSIGLTEEEMKSVRDNIDELSVADIKIQLNDIFSAKNLAQLKKEKFSTKEEIVDTVITDIPKKDRAKSKYAV